ncbi:MAG: hypothetical protein RMJ67_05875 [Elusimicrobiota bacterium]|nr:hypothetical protein [Endomicrobiia bacterium]MDW8166020.1 hypothetical protein [Elusimicrobiota bacterium]
MSSRFVKNQTEIERYRNKIFKSKDECRKIFAKKPFDEKLILSFRLYKRIEYLKKLKNAK